MKKEMSQLRLALLILLLSSSVFADTQLRILNSRHYRIHTDLEQSFAEDIARRMDGMFDEYARRLVEFHPEGDTPTFEVYLFKKRSDYLAFTNNRLENTGGVFMPTRHILAAFL